MPAGHRATVPKCHHATSHSCLATCGPVALPPCHPAPLPVPLGGVFLARIACASNIPRKRGLRAPIWPGLRSLSILLSIVFYCVLLKRSNECMSSIVLRDVWIDGRAFASRAATEQQHISNTATVVAATSATTAAQKRGSLIGWMSILFSFPKLFKNSLWRLC